MVSCSSRAYKRLPSCIRHRTLTYFLIRWNLYENETGEIAIGANNLAVSRDGNLFATGDGKGTVKVFTTSGFGLLYQLASQDPVCDIVFSPDSHRFYDVRGSYVDVWEPNALMSFAEDAPTGVDGESTESDRISLAGPTMFCQRIEAITALASVKNSHLCFSGRENGVVRLHHAQRGPLAVLHVSKGFLGIENLSCSSDGQYLFFSDLSRKIFVKTITVNATDKQDPVVETKAEIAGKKVGGPILALLCHQDSSHLLVQISSSLHVICLTSFDVIHSWKTPDAAEQQWIQHPQDASLIVGLGVGAILVLDWSLNERQRFTYECVPPRGQDSPGTDGTRSRGSRLDQVLVARDRKRILVKVSQNESLGSQEPSIVSL